MKKVRVAKLSIILLICLLSCGCTDQEKNQDKSGTNEQSESQSGIDELTETPADVQDQDESQTGGSLEQENDTLDYEEQDI